MGFLSKLHKKHVKKVTGGVSKASKLSPPPMGGPGQKQVKRAIGTGGGGQKQATRGMTTGGGGQKTASGNRAGARMSSLGMVSGSPSVHNRKRLK